MQARFDLSLRRDVVIYAFDTDSIDFAKLRKIIFSSIPAMVLLFRHLISICHNLRVHGLLTANSAIYILLYWHAVIP